MRFLDGAVPSFIAGQATIVEWQQTIMAVSDGAMAWHYTHTGVPTGLRMAGFFYTAGAKGGVGTEVPAEYARVFARGSSHSDVAFSWGGYQNGPTFGYVEGASLRGDGSIEAVDIRANNDLDVINDSTFQGPAGFNVVARSAHVTKATANPTVDVETEGQFIEWNLDGLNPNAAGSSTQTMTITGLSSGVYDSGLVVVAVRRNQDSLINKVDFTVAGYTSYLNWDDAQLSPVVDHGLLEPARYYDVYVGHYVHNKIYWNVQRYREIIGP
jgi:hypothetical protein